MGLFDLFKKNDGIQSPQTIPAIPDSRSSVPRVNTGPTLTDRLRTAMPSLAGLYPHEILMLNYANTYKNGHNNFQKFWLLDYSVDNPQSVLKSLLDRGFICLSDLSNTLNKLSVSELKDLLNRKNEKTSGKKIDLVSRVLTVYNQQQLEQMFPVRYYQLTKAGENEVLQNEYVIYLHRHHYMTVWEMNSLLKATHTEATHYRELIWREFNRKSIEYMKNCDWGLYRNNRLDMHDFVMEEKKYRSALQLLCEVISYDLSGHGNGETSPIQFNANLQNAIFESRMTNFLVSTNGKDVIIAPGLIKKFESLFKYLEVSSDEFVKIVYQLFGNIKIPERIFSAEESANIALSAIGLERPRAKDSLNIAKQRMRSLLKL